MKICSNINCKEINPQILTNFHKHKKHKDGYSYVCKKCANKETRIWSINNKDKRNEWNRVSNKNDPSKKKSKELRRNYWSHLTSAQAFEEYNKLLKEQNGLCKICKKLETAKHQNGKIKDLTVDHCHKTSKVRGLICFNCNIGLGKFKDNIEILKSAIDYLIK